MPFRAVHPPRNSKEKNKPNKNRTHSCIRLIQLQKKQTAVATCTYTIDVPDSTTDQPKKKCLGIRSITVGSSKEHRFQLQTWFSKGMLFKAVHPPRSSKKKTTPIKNRPDHCGRLFFVGKNNVATCTYTIDVPDSTMDQPKQN